MATFQSSISDFTQSSQWVGYLEWDDDLGNYVSRYTTPSTSTTNKTFSISGIPSGAIIDSATITQTANTPYTGISLRRLDSTDWTGSRDVTSQLQALGGTYTSITYEFKFKANGGSGGTSVGGTTITSTLSLTDTLLSVTYHMPTSTFVLNYMSRDAGQNITATITPSDPAYTHHVTWRLNSTYTQTNTVSAGNTTDIFTLPMTWCNAIPSSTSVGCTCTVETFSGSTSMGSVSDNFTMTVPSTVVPTITSLTYSGVSLYWSLFVQGKSKVQLTANGAAGAYSSTISSYQFTGMGINGTTNPYTTGYLTTANTNTFYVTVTDSRGRTSASKSTSFTVTAYSAPAITSTSSDRSDSSGTLDDEGTYGKFTMSYTWSNIGSNTRSTAVYYRESGETTWIEGSTTLISSGGYFLVNAPFDVATKYDVRFRIYDYFTSGSPIYAYGTLLTAAYIMDFNEDGDGVCVGGASTRAGFEISENWPLYAYGEQIGVPSNPNLLINGDFQVWQRGTSFASVAYTADRWHSNSASSTITQNGSCMQLVSASAWKYISQYIENPSRLSYKTVTASINIASCTGEIGLGIDFYRSGTRTVVKTTYASAGTTGIITITETLPVLYDTDTLRVFWGLFNATSGGTIVINSVKLEIGTIVTPNISRSYAQELALCQRYYTELKTLNATYIPYGFARSLGSSSGWRLYIPIPTSMRASPSVSGSNIAVIGNDNVTYTLTSMSVDRLSGGMVKLIAYSSTYPTSGPVGVVEATNTTSNNLAFDAEIYP